MATFHTTLYNSRQLYAILALELLLSLDEPLQLLAWKWNKFERRKCGEMTVGFWNVEKIALIYLYQELKNL
jgi:hypothetical protein